MLDKGYSDVLIVDLSQDGKAYSSTVRDVLQRHEGVTANLRGIMPSDEEIKASRLVLTDDRIADLHRGVAMPEFVIKLMLEAAERVRVAGVKAPPANWNEPHLWPARPTDK
jgi:hypothetical protein